MLRNKEEILKLIPWIFIILVAIYMRFAYLDSRGFVQADEGAYFRYVTENLHSHNIEGSMRIKTMWGKPIFFLTLYFESLMWKFTPYAMLLHSTVLGFFTVILVGWLGKKYFDENVGLFSMAIISVLHFHVFYSRNMKALSTALFFSALSLALILRWIKTRNRFALFSGGLFLSLAFGSHPNFAVSWLIILSFTCLAIAWFNYKSQMSWRHVLNEVGIFIGGVIIPILLLESFYLMTQYYLKFWDVSKMTYINSIFESARLNSSLAQGISPSFKLYLSTLNNSGLIFIILALGGTLTILKKRNYREGFYPFILISLIFWLTLAIFSLASGVAGFGRNLFQLLPAYGLLGGLGVAFLYKAVELRFPYKTRKKAGIMLKTAIICLIIFYGYTKSKDCLQNVSAAQQMKDYIKIDRASMSRPSKTTYFWVKYYFRDSSLFCSTWSEVFRNYISRSSEYLVLLHPSMTNAKELLDSTFKPTATFNHLNEGRSFSNFGLFDLNAERDIFKSLFGFSKVRQDNYPAKISLRCIDASTLEKEFLSLAKTFEIDHLKEAKLILINGRIKLEDQGDTLIITLGDKTNPYKYGMKIFQKKEPIQSIHSVWRLNESQTDKIYMSFCFVNSALKANGKDVSIKDFEISIYNLKPEFENLVNEAPLIIENKERERQYSEVLARYAHDFQPVDPIIINGDFSLIDKSDHTLPEGWKRWRRDDNVILDKQRRNNYILKVVCDPSDKWHFIKQRIPATKYKPNTRYRLRFRAKTNIKTEGQIQAYIQSWNPRWRKWLLLENFWKPWWSWYEFEFITPADNNLELVILAGNGKLNKVGGEIFFDDISISKVLR